MPSLSWIFCGYPNLKKPAAARAKSCYENLPLADNSISKVEGSGIIEAEIHAAASSHLKNLISKADILISKANKQTTTSTPFFSSRSHVWKKSIPKYEEAAKLYNTAKIYEKSKEALKKASEGKELIDLSSSRAYWIPRNLQSAAKDIIEAATLAGKLGNESEAVELYTRAYNLFRKASNIYFEKGKIREYKHTQEIGMKALKDVAPHVAISLYTHYFGIVEVGTDYPIKINLYHEAIEICIKLNKYTDAAFLLFKVGLNKDENNFANDTRCDAFVGSIIVYLYAQDFNQAEKCYHDCLEYLTKASSKHKECVTKLLAAYKEADADEIKRVVARKVSRIGGLSRTIVKLADSLPTSGAKKAVFT